ncbi:MAG TPA: trans-aconitate 2-methyltransferase [Rhodopila sp.]|nr:trans-aconitate 2-methyltransferase [Rhodopila sp.]
MSWSAQQYTTFEKERTRPVRDLLNAVDMESPRRAIDLGCGPGNSTEVLAERFPGAAILGFDSSADMIDAARRRLPRLQFDLGDIQTWNAPEDDPGGFDIILANAVLQWVPNHDSLMPRLMRALSDGGSLAVQMPDNLEEPAHQLMRQMASEPRFAGKLSTAAGSRQARVDATWYYKLLRPHATRVDVWRTTYHHVLSGGTDAIVEWFKGSGLRPFLAPLDPVEQQAFLADYRAALIDAYPVMADGSVLLPFPRLFVVAVR